MEAFLIARLGAMGDILHALPAVAALHAHRPETSIAWLVEPRWRALLPPFVTPIEVDTRRWRKNLLGADTRREVRAPRLRARRACGKDGRPPHACRGAARRRGTRWVRHGTGGP